MATCQGCGVGFEARRASAKWCSDRCRKAAGRRAGVAQPAPESRPAAASTPDSDLLRVVRRDLELAGQLDSVDGQLALRLAEEISAEDCKGIAVLSRQLTGTLVRVRLAANLPPDGEDEVARARRRRDEMLRELGLDPGAKP